MAADEGKEPVFSVTALPSEGTPEREEWRRKAAAAAQANKDRIRAEEEAAGRVRPNGDPVAAVDLVDAVLRAAEKSTGMTRQQLLDAAAALPPPPAVRDLTTDQRWLARRAMLKAGAPELHIQNVVDVAPIQCDALDAVMAFLSLPHLSILVLSGGYGTRKSGSACWMLSVMTGAYVSSYNLVDLAINDRDRFETIRTAKAVVCDDFGTEVDDKQGFFRSTFNRCGDSWYQQVTKLIITTNLDKQAFHLLCGDRFWERCDERGLWVDIGGTSVRRQIGTRFRLAAKAEKGGDGK